jgi:hypothetical protein
LFLFHDDSRPVGQNFGYALHDLRCVVAESDHRVSAHLIGVLNQQIERMLSGLLAKIRQDRDIATDDRLQSSSDRAKDRTRPYDDSSYYAEVTCYFISIDIERRGHHRVAQAHSRLYAHSSSHGSSTEFYARAPQKP